MLAGLQASRVLAAALLTGCVSTQVRTARDATGAPVSVSGRVVLVEPDIELYEVLAGGGVVVVGAALVAVVLAGAGLVGVEVGDGVADVGGGVVDGGVCSGDVEPGADGDVVTSDGDGLGLLEPVDGESGVVEMVIGGIGVFGTVVAAGVGTSSAADAGTV